MEQDTSRRERKAYGQTGRERWKGGERERENERTRERDTESESFG